ncbi:MAG: AAA family ATPase [Chloroflexi bacterium]|nr:AAA family ATPase [Chloroflexota bacterium]
MKKTIVDDLEALLNTLPPYIQEPLREREELSNLLEVVLDLGRPPEARFPPEDVHLDSRNVTEEDLQYVMQRIGAFGGDNRAGIERTLHRFSAIRNRNGKVVGITCRVGRAVFGTIQPIEDLISMGKNVLLLGRPGVGKTTMLREVARVLADDARKRVITVDTSNEIAGDGDVPHPGIGRARRMQVPTPSLQHSVMIEAVENHMPEVIIVDEMGTELEAAAARTIAERGVQLIATAHGNTLENLVLNPTLSDLVGGVQTVILGDEEARRRRTQKTVLERKQPPTFDIVVEIQDWERMAVHTDVAQVVDAMLRGVPPTPELRWTDEQGSVQKGLPAAAEPRRSEAAPSGTAQTTRVHLWGVSREAVEQVAHDVGLPVQVVDNLADADILLTTKARFRRGSRMLKTADEAGKPVYVLRRNTSSQIQQFLASLGSRNGRPSVPEALDEARQAVERIWQGEAQVQLSPQDSYTRRLQHQLIGRYNLPSTSVGREPYRRVTVSRPGS